MQLHIRPGKVTCAGIVAIFMILPNSIWKGSDAKDAPPAKPALEITEKLDSDGGRVKFREMAR